MDLLLSLAKGPLFRFAFALMVLGLLRNLYLALVGRRANRARLEDNGETSGGPIRRTGRWLLAVGRPVRIRPAYGLASLVLHAGLIAVPVFLFAHIRLWERSLGIAWPALPRLAADGLTLLVVTAALVLFGLRLAAGIARSGSRTTDFLWLALLGVCFAAGFLAAHPAMCPVPYKAMLAVHVLLGDAILVLVPFTKVTRCMLFPLAIRHGRWGGRIPSGVDIPTEERLRRRGQPA